jgi:hypothetical protein
LSIGAGKVWSTIPLLFEYVEEARFAVHAMLHIAFKGGPDRLPIMAPGLARSG